MSDFALRCNRKVDARHFDLSLLTIIHAICEIEIEIGAEKNKGNEDLEFLKSVLFMEKKGFAFSIESIYISLGTKKLLMKSQIT